jgi:radical SAM superfamily enzyme YgiQ (UPF0313 family)
MKIKLISPDPQWDSRVCSSETHKVLKVSLPLLAALTPPGHEIKIVDEAFAPDDTEEAVDIVGLTVMTELAPRAYRLADLYRARGVKVVLGGIHPTVLPEEALRHADAVVIGEGEETWPALVRDAAAGKLASVYRAPGPSDLSRLPIPARQLYPRPARRALTPLGVGIEASRGCAYDCEFCSIGRVMGRTYRARPVGRVLDEIAAIESVHLFFVDDALALDRRTAKTLFTEMAPFRTKWIGQGTLSLAEDLDLLRLMRRAGCHGLLVGFETVTPAAQDTLRKSRALKITPAEAARRFHGEGISLLGAFIFGFDHETGDVFDRTIEFALRLRLEALQVRLLTPFPGTALYERLQAAGRLFAPDWWLEGFQPGKLLFRPQGMAPEALIEGVARVQRELHSWPGIARRFFGVIPLKRRPIDLALYAGLNLGQRKRYYAEHRAQAYGRPAARVRSSETPAPVAPPRRDSRPVS